MTSDAPRDTGSAAPGTRGPARPTREAGPPPAALRALFDSDVLAMACWGGDGELLAANQAFLDLIGAPRSTLPALHMDRLIHPEDREPAAAALRAIRSGRARSRELELRLVRADGSAHPVVWLACAVPPAPGQPAERSERSARPAGAARPADPARPGQTALVTVVRDRTPRPAQPDAGLDQAFLLELTGALQALDEPATLAGEAARRMAAHFGVACCFFGEIDEPVGTVRYHPLPAPAGSTGVAASALRLPLPDLGDEGAAALRDDRAIAIADVAPESDPQPDVPEDAPVIAPSFAGLGVPAARALLRVPVRSGGRLQGLVELRHDRPRAWSGRDEVLLRAAAGRVWPALAAARARSGEHAARLRLERLQRAVAAVTGALEPDGVARALVTEVLDLAGAAMGTVGFLTADQRHLEIIAHAGMDDDAGRAWHRFLNVPGVGVRDVTTRGEPLFCETRDAYVGRYPAGARPAGLLGLEALAILPIAGDTRTFGALALGYREAHPFPAEERELLASFAHQCARALERAELYAAEREARAEAELAHTEVEAALEEARTAYVQAETARRDSQELALSLEKANQELRLLAAARDAANRAKSDFLAVMSHELRTPLNAVIGYAQILEIGVYGPLAEPQLEQIRRIQTSALHLLHIIEGVLAFTRVEARPAEPELQDVSLADAFAGLDVLVEPHARDRQIHLALDPDACTDRVRADPGKLRQILLNLLANAVKFTPPGGRVRVECQTTPRELVIRVHDTGIGIPADKLETIFEPFVQVDMGLTREFAGTGLGLAISRDLARAMAGDISVVSVLGQGSTFSLRLPRAQPPATDAAARPRFTRTDDR